MNSKENEEEKSEWPQANEAMAGAKSLISGSWLSSLSHFLGTGEIAQQLVNSSFRELHLTPSPHVVAQNHL